MTDMARYISGQASEGMRGMGFEPKNSYEIRPLGAGGTVTNATLSLTGLIGERLGLPAGAAGSTAVCPPTKLGLYGRGCKNIPFIIV